MMATSAGAADLRNVLTDYTITSWSQREGLLPGNVWALAQDRAGYLWVGSDAGLFRFDGTRFTRRPLEKADSAPLPIRALYVSSDGSVWVGCGDGGALFQIGAEETRHFGEADGLVGVTILAIIEDAAGTLWAGGDQGFFRFEDGRWTLVGPEQGLPSVAVYGAFVSSRGELFVGTATGVYRRAAHEQRFVSLEALTSPSGPSLDEGFVGRFQRSLTEDASGRVPATVAGFPRSFAEDATGRVLVNDWNTALHVAGAPASQPVVKEKGRGFRLLFDRAGNLWVGTVGQGLWRVRAHHGGAAVPERANALTGLLSDGVGSLLEDKDGNIWVGTTEGLCRLTLRRIIQITNQGLVVAIESTPDGGIWMATDSALRRFGAEGVESPAVEIPLGDTRLRAMHADEHGTLWIATDRYFARVRAGTTRLERLAVNASWRADLMTSDFNDGVWLYTDTGELQRWHEGAVTKVPLPPVLARTTIGLLYTDTGGHLWLGLNDGRVAVRGADEAFSVYGPHDGLTAGTYRQIFEDHEGVVWLAATGGLSQFVDGRFVTLRSDQGFPVSDLTAIAQDDAGSLWIATGFGLLRTTKRDFDAVVNKTATTMRYTSYDRSDGLAGLTHAYNSNRRVARAADGRLWFVTSRGLSLLDPRAFSDEPPQPPITVEYVIANERRYEPPASILLPARTARVEIAYSELNLNTPLRTRFRHRLEGFESQWVDAGTRRTAFYTNLPPGTYQFRVLASRSDGSWALPGATLAFSIAPVFYQTLWFRAVVMLMVGLTLWGLWQFRLRQVRRQFALILGERVRLSRELHDTLLQSLVGITLQFDAIAASIDSTAPAMRSHFVRMRKQVEEYIREARHSIWDLRSPRLERPELSTSLRESFERATAGQLARSEFSVSGAPRAASAKIEDELRRISQEAVTNAVRHSQATVIRLGLGYTPEAITIQVSDNGCGIDQATLDAGPADHYGLASMRERAAEIGARLDIASHPRHGTVITVSVQA